MFAKHRRYDTGPINEYHTAKNALVTFLVKKVHLDVRSFVEQISKLRQKHSVRIWFCRAAEGFNGFCTESFFFHFSQF